MARLVLSALLCALPFSAAISPQVLDERDNVEAYTYTQMGNAWAGHDVQTYYTTSVRPCTVTKTDRQTTTKWTDAMSTFTATTTTTTTVTAKTAYTSTILASKGFIPIDKSVPGASYDPAASLKKREAEAVATSPAQPALVARNRNGWGSGSDSGYGHPQKVDVVYWKQPKDSDCSVETTTETAEEWRCKSRVPTTVTKTITATSTKYPSTASPFYEVCGTNNRATAYKGLRLAGLRAENTTQSPDDPTNPTGYTFSFLDISDGYTCCVAAFSASPSVAFWGVSQFLVNTTETVCIIGYLDECKGLQKTPTDKALTFEIRASTSGYTDQIVYTAGNGYCGQWFRGCTVEPDDNGPYEVCSPPRPAS